MKYGICTGLPASEADLATGAPDMIGLAAELGYDYVEMPLAPLAELGEAEFLQVKQKLASAGIKCECLNIFFPASVRLTGDGADEALAGSYIDRALGRAREIGASVVVFGSSGARNVPEKFPYERAFDQLAGMLRVASAAAERNGIEIAIEALNRNESNIILSLGEADRLAVAAGQPNIKILLDYYHFSVESDSKDVLRRLLREKKIIHAHFADPASRGYPQENKPEYAPTFDILREESYGGRFSIEARLGNPNTPRAEMESGLAALRKIIAL